ncbi:MAG: hypothetical protein OHK006_21230 [Thermodesulfovibrionales bacterium]
MQRKAIVVLGMHRSGTSAMSGSLCMAGVELGPDPMQPTPDNPKGFFENQFITDCSDEVLRLLGSCWDDPFPLPDGWHRNEALAPVRQELTAYIRDRFPSGRVIGFKDPRLCLLLPFFQGILGDLGVQPHFIIMLRNPAEIAESLMKRNGFSREKSLQLWMKHLFAAEHSTRGFPRRAIRFDDLLAAPQETLRMISDSFGIPLTLPAKAHQDPSADFLDPALRHHVREPDSIACAFAVRCLHAFDRLAESDSADVQEQLDSLGQEFRELSGLFYSAEIRRNASSVCGLPAAERDDLRAAAGGQTCPVREELNQIKGSRGWKLLGRYYRLKEFFRRA